MSDLELEKAAMGPRRWIGFCAAFQKELVNDPSAELCPRTTRNINDLFPTVLSYHTSKFFIVPGGRYLVVSSRDSISVLDLGYTSSADCRVIASVGVECNFKCKVQATADGMGLVIFSINK